MKVFYVTNAEHCSYNNTKSWQAFKTNVQTELNRKYSMLYARLPIKEKSTKDLVFLMPQLHSGVTLDADNPTHKMVNRSLL